jgi:Protein of unknown function (DUF3574)
MRRALRVTGATAAAMAIAGCAAPPGTCILPTQKPMLEVDFFFGRDIAGRLPLSDSEWADFAAQEITPRFPDGFTVIDAKGQWLNPGSSAMNREASKVVRVVVPGGGNISARVQAVSSAYRLRFHQDAVGVVSAPVCAAF